MTNEVKQEKTAFLFQTIDGFFNDKIDLIVRELKCHSVLDKEAVANLF